MIQSQQARRGQQVALAVSRQCSDQYAEIISAQADDGTIGQVAQGVVVGIAVAILDRLQHPANRQPGAAEIGAAQAASAAAGIHCPLHAQGVADVTGHFDNRGFNHHLGARHVQLAHDVFQGRHHVRFGQQYQGVEAFVSANQDGLRFAGGFPAGFRFELLGNLAEGFRQALGIAMTQANHAGVG